MSKVTGCIVNTAIFLILVLIIMMWADTFIDNSNEQVIVESSNVFKATHYAGELNGRPMAWKEMPYDPFDLTCAHSMYPFGTVLRVTNTENGRTVDVVVTDRHDYKTDLDLSFIAYTTLRDWDWNDSGHTPVTMEVLP